MRQRRWIHAFFGYILLVLSSTSFVQAPAVAADVPEEISVEDMEIIRELALLQAMDMMAAEDVDLLKDYDGVSDLSEGGDRNE